MLRGMINQQGHCFGVKDDVSETNKYVYMFSSKSLDSGA